MLRAPIWITSATSTHGLDIARVEQLGDDRQAGLRLGLGEQPQPLRPRPWKEYGEERGLKAPPRNRLAPPAATSARGVSIWSRDSTVQGPAIREKCSPPMRRPSISTTVRSPRLSCARGELVGLEDRHDLLDPGEALEAESGDVLAVADRPDDGHLLAARGWARAPHGLDPGDDGLDLSSVAVGFITIIICCCTPGIYAGVNDRYCRWWRRSARGPVDAEAPSRRCHAGRAPS